MQFLSCAAAALAVQSNVCAFFVAALVVSIAHPVESGGQSCCEGRAGCQACRERRQSVVDAPVTTVAYIEIPVWCKNVAMSFAQPPSALPVPPRLASPRTMNKIMNLLTRLRRLQRIMLNWQNVIHGVLCTHLPLPLLLQRVFSSAFSFLCRL